MTSVRTPGERAGLTRAAIITTARESLADRGARGLSIRAVAARLGVAPNALYSHVEGKAALVDAVLDDLIGAIPLPDPALTPRDGLVAIMRDSFDALVRHPDLVALSLARQGSGGANAWRLGDRMLELFAEAGVPDAAARDGLRVLLVHMMGCAAFATQYDPELGTVPPHPVASVRADYLVALGWLLDGILS
ncbi:MAG TPA: helix-turn-helix domain-containing protein [Solirubrobacteraceae bacterium]|nr:helix-turn-helix domain-containing protein [Solirubrobacteraceae bacterium]